MIFAFGFFCVYAVQNFSLNSGGEIRFVAPSLSATISNASLSGVDKKVGSGTMSSFSITSDMTTEQIEALPNYKSWSGISLLFNDDSEGMGEISFTVTNNSTKSTENIMVEISTNTTENSPIQAIPSADFCISPGGHHTFTIKLMVSNQENSAIIKDFLLTVELSLLKPSEVSNVVGNSGASDFDIKTKTNPETNTNTAVISAYKGTATEVEIPAVVKDQNDKIYTVTETLNATTTLSSAFISVKDTLTKITLPRTLTTIGGGRLMIVSNLPGRWKFLQV